MSTQPPTDDAPFTTGEFTADDVFVYKVIRGDRCVFVSETDNSNDAKIIAKALNAATSLHCAGYDAQKVFEQLPQILAIVKRAADFYDLGTAEEMERNLRRKPKP